MSKMNIIRAWKDEDYRLSLSEAERALLPEHPAGLIELSGAEMDGDGGGGLPAVHYTFPPVCNGPTSSFIPIGAGKIGPEILLPQGLMPILSHA
jgi:mersacidin/lichenicidin family type 2 lantibiotic